MTGVGTGHQTLLISRASIQIYLAFMRLRLGWAALSTCLGALVTDLSKMVANDWPPSYTRLH